MKMMLVLSLIILGLILNACTYNISMTHIDGTSSNTLDDDVNNSPTTTPSLVIPAV